MVSENTGLQREAGSAPEGDTLPHLLREGMRMPLFATEFGLIAYDISCFIVSKYIPQSLVLSSEGQSLTSQLVEGWNGLVKTAFLTIAGRSGGLQLETLSSLKVGLRRWGSEIKKSVTGSNSDHKS